MDIEQAVAKEATRIATAKANDDAGRFLHGAGMGRPILDQPLFGRKHSGALKVRDFDLTTKAIGDDGTFEGYGSVWGVVDSYGEVVAKGAFTESLAELAAKKRPVPVLWQHRSGEPIGAWSNLREDDHGLAGNAELLIADVAQAREAHALVKRKIVTGLSIGYWVRKSSYDEKTGIRTLTKLDLVEISLVTFPANDDARVGPAGVRGDDDSEDGE